jgi:hypothetical protein
MKRTESLNSNSDAFKARNFAVWCEHCSIRIAPNEERVTVKNKTYHERCYAKSKAIGEAEK